MLLPLLLFLLPEAAAWTAHACSSSLALPCVRCANVPRCAAPAGSDAATAADEDALTTTTAAAEFEVAQARARLDSASPADKAQLIQQLKDAEAALAELRANDDRRACEARIDGCTGGE